MSTQHIRTEMHLEGVSLGSEGADVDFDEFASNANDTSTWFDATK